MQCAERDGNSGFVYLVGAGPGDPSLLTLKGKEAIGKADVLVYDRLVSERLLDFAKPGCEFVYVGKHPTNHAVPQHAINELLVEKAQTGAVVVRLKGGDPFVFGRGGEEADALREHGIPFAIVPGVTSAIAAPAYAGIPVTHRSAASSFTVITGHEHADKDESSIPWEQVANLRGTLVFLMGMDNLPLIVGKLLEHGMDGATPAAVVHRGTWACQKTVCATLASIEDKVAEQGIENPSVIVVGQVAALHERLGWFEERPLFGKTVIVTRARHQLSALAAKLEELGAQVIECPLIEITPPSDPHALGDAVENIGRYRWLVFTSANGVDAFFAEARAQGKDARILSGLDIAVIGTGTEAALARFGITQVMVPEEFCAEGLVALLAPKVNAGERVLVARAEAARDVLVSMLQAQGADVDDVAAYATREARGCGEALVRALQSETVDAITFTSSSTVRSLVGCLGADAALIEDAALFSIGPITSQTMRDFGLEPRGQASTYTIDGLVEAIVASLGGVR
ncbi:uroporphyrinogen-III C-methyltransferase [Raoultibacter phocaeensis]|uniref:uroporphyrinogen-III C-methyltransferase n=1 Tax=Raoultibacter phocaeensis TaxID=2479841 RepID=UPI00111AEC14|nr:uroporphyrinogen-III C-methyltransferase [Raoultibacter phocaeensis]